MVYWTPYKPLDLNLLYPPIVNPIKHIPLVFLLV